MLTKENLILKNELQRLNREMDLETKTFFTNNSITEVLKLLFEQSGKKKILYDERIKKLSIYLFQIGGKLCYETIQANFSLPSLTSVYRYMKSSASNIEEGQFRWKELEDYLKKHNVQDVWLSEDATKITEKIQYNCKTNQLTGFVLPYDENGVPRQNIYQARYASEIQDHMLGQNAISTQVKFIFIF